MAKQISRDPILDEALRIRADYCNEFHHDLDAMVEDLKKVQAQAVKEGFKVVSYESEKPAKKKAAA